MCWQDPTWQDKCDDATIWMPDAMSTADAGGGAAMCAAILPSPEPESHNCLPVIQHWHANQEFSFFYIILQYK